MEQAGALRNLRVRLKPPVMKTVVVLAALALAAVPPAASAAPQVTAAWSRPAAKGTTGAGFMNLSNPGARADALVSVASPWAKDVMIHQSTISGGVASMRMVTSVPVPAHGAVTFAPGGYHLMFTGLTRPLKVGDRLPATLAFASGAKVKASFVVGLAPPVAASPGH
jgi:copper(I)-binding protein